MGNINHLLYVGKYTSQFQGPFLEVGSRDYGNTQDLKQLFNTEYIRVDMQPGKGVDKVLDITHDFDEIDRQLEHKRFGTIFCMSVLEHCKDPFKAAKNLTGLLKEGGKLILAVPFSWKIHAYPDDYWRFTPAGVKVLFNQLDFDPDMCMTSTAKKGDLELINDKYIGRISFSFSRHRKKGHIIRGISANMLRGLSHIGILRWLAGYAYVLAPTNVIMTGTLRN